MVEPYEGLTIAARVGYRKFGKRAPKATYYNLRRRDRSFGVGELVLRRQHTLSSATQNIAAKLSPKFQGPFKIRKVLSPVVYELANLEDTAVGKMHVKDLKPYRSPHPD